MPNEWNTNFVTPENDEKLVESIRRNGLFKPIIVREVAGLVGYQIIGGEHRWGAAKAAGLAEVPIVNLGFIDDQRAKEISVIDNSRYGDDDTIQFAELLKQIGDTDELQSYLPYGDTDLSAIFSSVNIALDDLEFDENFDAAIPDASDPEPVAPKAPKTHAVLRFKVPLKDAERITALIAKTQKEQGFTTEDDLTNAGDALVHLIMPSVMAASQPSED